MDRANSLRPSSGMALTVVIGGDRYAGTVRRVAGSGDKFWFTYDLLSHLGGKKRMLPAQLDAQGQWRYGREEHLIVLGGRLELLDSALA